MTDERKEKETNQDTVETFDQTVEVELVEPDGTGPVIHLTQKPTDMVIDATLENVDTVIDPDETLECDICGRQAIVVVDDSEHTTLCYECYDAYFQEQPGWSVREYLGRQRRKSTSGDDKG